jgi:hypothetical protein
MRRERGAWNVECGVFGGKPVAAILFLAAIIPLY